MIQPFQNQTLPRRWRGAASAGLLNIHGVLGAIAGSYEFVFNANLMLEVLGYTDAFSQSLQKRDQDIIKLSHLLVWLRGSCKI
jgi:hypothetical protein